MHAKPLWILTAALVTSVGGLGCRGKESASGDAGVAAASGEGAERSATTTQGATVTTATTATTLTQRVTKDDCTRWAAHGVQVLMADWKDAASQCPAELRDSVTRRFEEQRVSIEAGAMAVCSSHLGASYPVDGARCYAAAGSVRALTGCKFAPMTDPDDSDVAGEIDKLRRSCTSGGGAPPAPTSL